MKVVLFCGGYGMRMRDGQSDIPKPMTTVGPRPLIWHVMRYYAHFGHKDFVLCLGYGAHHIKDYFLNYSETASNDFVLAGGRVELLGSDIQDWNITFVHTGLDSSIGERLRRVREHVQDEEMFLANYADVLTDLPLNDMIDTFKASEAVAALAAVPPQTAFHCVEVDDDGMLTGIKTLQDMPVWLNGGYFVLRPEVFDYVPKDGDLVADACTALAAEGRMLAYRHHGFWHPADTVKERTALEAAYRAGKSPWMVWQAGPQRDPLQATIAALGAAEH
ncbi:sugar phosphate nucleotidyltransferase [Pseudonocardia benzenivorans]|uniref:Glucose-1-phosphate cytidylyltransferase n=2 Tax=Pseudonocardia TaxID=1847 RepID=F4CR36_PSEUX|nr:sugar phosphate nucleotidyltransferase [Pseudonocardia dioxanivorans]AEA24094.1 Glucose-1-phosphate cytidylyltransferase [Pseudonocardia dioxanivorans CB1190]GJF07470.1 glucose-1-phosphate cytidylyltransferase [Pseudonocardia sp. D17]